MGRLLLLTAFGLIVPPLLAGPEILPIDGLQGHLRYNVATGAVTPITAQTRDLGAPLWYTPYSYVNGFGAQNPWAGDSTMDWGDLGDVTEPGVGIGGFGFLQYTNSQATDGDLYAIYLMYEGVNDCDNCDDWVFVQGWMVANIPGSVHPPDEYWGYIWRVEVETFVLDGSDIDGDNLRDFGYWCFLSGQTPGCLHGQGICGLIDPNNLPPECPGVEDAFCLFQNNGPNNIDPNNMQPYLVGTYDFGGAVNGYPFAQFFFELYAPVCPNQGNSGRYCEADIDGSYDCIVGLADLAKLLQNYGCGTPIDPNCVATLMMGDVDPYDPWWPGDGDVDLADLAELLSQYGDDCNWP